MKFGEGGDLETWRAAMDEWAAELRGCIARRADGLYEVDHYGLMRLHCPIAAVASRAGRVVRLPFGEVELIPRGGADGRFPAEETGSPFPDWEAVNRGRR